MKRYEFEKAVYESSLDKMEKQILVYYAYRKNWNGDGKVWVSAMTVARDTGLSTTTVARRMVGLREAGWLVPTGTVYGNGSLEYDLAIGDSTRLVTVAPTPVLETSTTGSL